MLEAVQGLYMLPERDRGQASCEVMQGGQYHCASMAGILGPTVNRKLLPYVRHSFCCPEAVVCSVVVQRHAAGGGGAGPRCRCAAELGKTSGCAQTAPPGSPGWPQ
ncbi:unnamed protein product [Prorocentrum cordatum]|uniref:Uncharacterized protein n=1 Tax=Prorocentrum cordatum TaxID=2364126 RepID=A0ABN9TB95_9DINO|nr:unnamed protein product [Polarella glacialis]